MLKKFITLVAIISVILTLPIMANAEGNNIETPNAVTTEDSKTIRAEILSNLNVSAESDILRVYSVDIVDAFAEWDNIDDVLASRELLEIYYAIGNGKEDYSYYTESGIRKNIDFINIRSMERCKSGDVTANIANDVVVNNTYYLNGESCNVGSAIYYKTNKGDYVYYYHHSIGEYLFPIHAFCAYQKAVLLKMIANGDSDGDVDFRSIWDLSPYDFNSSAFNLNAEIPSNKDADKENKNDASDIVEATDPSNEEPIDNDYTWIIVIAACLLIAGIAGGIIWWHKRRKE